jgi:hypothetical protein
MLRRIGTNSLIKMRYLILCVGLALCACLAFRAVPTAEAAGDAPAYIAVDVVVQGADGTAAVHLVGRSGGEATNATLAVAPAAAAAKANILATVRPVLQSDGRIRLHYEVKTVDVARRSAAGSANASAEYPQVRDIMVVNDAVLADGVAVKKPLGGGVQLSLRARRLKEPPTDDTRPVEARFSGAK